LHLCKCSLIEPETFTLQQGHSIACAAYEANPAKRPIATIARVTILISPPHFTFIVSGQSGHFFFRTALKGFPRD
jgi:hypothetical protein